MSGIDMEISSLLDGWKKEVDELDSPRTKKAAVDFDLQEFCDKVSIIPNPQGDYVPSSLSKELEREIEFYRVILEDILKTTRNKKVVEIANIGLFGKSK